jgi:hypothetical protein
MTYTLKDTINNTYLGYSYFYVIYNRIFYTSIKIKAFVALKVQAWARLISNKIETRCTVGLSFYNSNWKNYTVSGILNK